MTLINPHIMKAIADERIADLQRGAAPRSEQPLRASRTRRIKRLAIRTRVVSAIRPQQP